MSTTNNVAVIDLASVDVIITGRVAKATTHGRVLLLWELPKGLPSTAEAVFLTLDEVAATATIATEDGLLPVALFNPFTSCLSLGPAANGRVFQSLEHVAFTQSFVTATVGANTVVLPGAVFTEVTDLAALAEQNLAAMSS